MISPKSKRDKEIYQFLKSGLSNKYNVHYKNFSIPLEWFNLKIDFIIQLKPEFLWDKDRDIIFYIQNAQNASLRKMTQIYDLLLSYNSVSVIWDDDRVAEKLSPLITMLNELVNENGNSLFSANPNLQFLMFCDNNDTNEIIRYREEIQTFTGALIELENDHGVEEDEEEYEEEDGFDDSLN